ncbi:hypothetical protein [Erythrobacter litoralis]|uniref:Uncharacterized protein n=1 Tax=Erythrobacter litoralis (strain HTCC2594) TaxID=314225 RepID=Q2ND82_ERYLH|nr:hypothetical protein [Erythrobacter litoralis]ABC62359.1 hypothetical protein ELI_01335 [Erythrobacter litoralis HTCC2594]
MDDQEKLARQRFMLLQIIRLGGAAMAMIGAVIISGRWIDSPELGYVLLVLGALEFFIVPNLVAKSWHAPDP